MVDVDARLEALGILGSVREEREYRYLRNVVAQGDHFDLEREVRDLQAAHEREEAVRIAEAARALAASTSRFVGSAVVTSD